MKMTYTKSQFDVQDGKYTAKFLGTTFRDDPPGTPPRLGQDGKPLPPAMTWDFEIVGPVEVGKRVDKLTGRVPTPKSGCGKMLVAITDTMLKDGQEVDLAQFVGQLYRVTVENSRVADSPPPARIYGSAGATSADLAAGQVSAPTPPPPGSRSAPPPPPKAVQLWWLTHDGVTTPDPVPEARIIDLIRGGMDPVAALVCAVGSDQWRPASEAIPAARSVIPF